MNNSGRETLPAGGGKMLSPVKPIISVATEEVLPDTFSCLWANTLARAFPRPSSRTLLVRTPTYIKSVISSHNNMILFSIKHVQRTNVLFPLSTLPTVATRMHSGAELFSYISKVDSVVIVSQITQEKKYIYLSFHAKPLLCRQLEIGAIILYCSYQV